MRDEDSIVVLICAVFVFWVLAIGVYFFSDNIRDLLGIDNRTSATVETQTQAGLAKIGVEKHTEKTQSDSEVKKKETTVKQISPTKDVEPVITSDVEPVIEKTEHDIMVEEGWALEYDESDYANKTIHWLFNDQFCRESIAYSYDHLVIVDDKYATWRGSPVQYKDIQLDYIMCYYFNDETLAEVCTLFFAPNENIANTYYRELNQNANVSSSILNNVVIVFGDDRTIIGTTKLYGDDGVADFYSKMNEVIQYYR